MVGICHLGIWLSGLDLGRHLSELSCGFGWLLVSVSAASLDEDVREFLEVDDTVSTLVVVSKDSVHVLK